MPNSRKPFRINIGFIAHEEIGRNHNFPFAIDKITLGDDLELRSLDGNVNIGRTPQGLVVQAEFSAATTLGCVGRNYFGITCRCEPLLLYFGGEAIS